MNERVKRIALFTGKSEAEVEAALIPHPYVPTVPYKGCGQCQFGPGAIQHNDHASSLTGLDDATDGRPDNT